MVYGERGVSFDSHTTEPRQTIGVEKANPNLGKSDPGLACGGGGLTGWISHVKIKQSGPTFHLRAPTTTRCLYAEGSLKCGGGHWLRHQVPSEGSALLQETDALQRAHRLSTLGIDHVVLTSPAILAMAIKCHGSHLIGQFAIGRAFGFPIAMLVRVIELLSP